MSSSSEPHGGATEGSRGVSAAPTPHRGAGSHVLGFARAFASAVLIALTCVLVPVSLITVWVHDIVLDTDRYVQTVKPLATDPAIEDAAANRIVRAVDVRADGKAVTSDVAGWLESQGLPPRVGDAVRSLAPQLDDAVTQVARKAADRFVTSDRFETIWTQANRKAHTAVVDVLTGDGRGAVGINGGTVTLDVGDAVENVRQSLVDAGVKPASRIPDVDKQMVLFRSDQMNKVRNAAHALDVIGNWLPVITVVIGAIGIALARRRRRALVTTAFGVAAACVVMLVALAIVRRYYMDHLPPEVLSPAAAGAVFDRLLHFLKVSTVTGLVLGLVVAIGAYLSGTGGLPRALRGGTDRTADSVARWGDTHGLTAGPVGTWVDAYRRWLILGLVLLVALWFALWNHPTALTIVLLVVILLVLLAVVALLAASGRVTRSHEDSRAHG
ncbi:hypothetical protein [Embleya sp. NPDC001921]